MTVRLIAISQPAIDGPKSSADLLAFCARVSSTANQGNNETGPKLIRSLINREEWSPLEMVSLTMEITTTRDISRQILRHRSFSFQEFSQRYAEVEDNPVFREARDQDPSDRQGSTLNTDRATQHDWTGAQHVVWRHAIYAYKKALANGMAKEVARALLPEGLTPTTLYMAGTLRSWWHYCQLRCQQGTQREHRLIADNCLALILSNFPALAIA